MHSRHTNNHQYLLQFPLVRRSILVTANPPRAHQRSIVLSRHCSAWLIDRPSPHQSHRQRHAINQHLNSAGTGGLLQLPPHHTILRRCELALLNRRESASSEIQRSLNTNGKIIRSIHKVYSSLNFALFNGSDIMAAVLITTYTPRANVQPGYSPRA